MKSFTIEKFLFITQQLFWVSLVIWVGNGCNSKTTDVPFSLTQPMATMPNLNQPTTHVAPIKVSITPSPTTVTQTEVPSPAPPTPTPPLTPTPILPTPTNTPPPFEFQGSVVFGISAASQPESIWAISSPTDTPKKLLTLPAGSILNDVLLSPTATHLAYVQTKDGLTSVWLMDLLTGETKQWSQSFVVTYRRIQDMDETTFGLLLHSWSPNGQHLLVQEWKLQWIGEIEYFSYVLTIEKEGLVLGKQILDASWSMTHNSQLVYSTKTEGIFFLDVTQPQNATRLLLSKEAPLLVGSLAWHPKQKELFFFNQEDDYRSSGHGVWHISFLTNQWQKVADHIPGGGYLRLSPNGRFLLWSTGYQVTVFDLADDFKEYPIDLDAIRFFYGTESVVQSPWLTDSSYIGVLIGSRESTGYDLCFYSVWSGKRVGCPFLGDSIVKQLNLPLHLLMIVTWSPSAIPSE